MTILLAIIAAAALLGPSRGQEDVEDCGVLGRISGEMTGKKAKGLKSACECELICLESAGYSFHPSKGACRCYSSINVFTENQGQKLRVGRIEPGTPAPTHFAWDIQERHKLPVPEGFVEFGTQEGYKMLMESEYVDMEEIGENYPTQYNFRYCSVATAVALLNGLKIGAPKPNGRDFDGYPYWGQLEFSKNECVQKTCDPNIKDPGLGCTLSQAVESLRCVPGVQVRKVHGNEVSVAEFRDEMKTVLNTQQMFMGINYHRSTSGQSGGGHFSFPVAYHEGQDKVLMFDVARYKYPALWFPLKALHKSIVTMDSDAGPGYRGYYVLSLSD